MNLQELKSFKLSDAVGMHSELNPKLWHDNQLDLKVRVQLLKIARDFIDYLGIDEIHLKDVRILGSNVAYSYTPHSDLDLHLFVDMDKLNPDEVYQELFASKKMLYNDGRKITVHGIPVECYVQDINTPAVSLGEFSVLKNKWIRHPVKRKLTIDHSEAKAKYEKMRHLVDLALDSPRHTFIRRVLEKLNQYRRAGLQRSGEYSAENIAYKVIRQSGDISELYKRRDELIGKSLSIESMYVDESYSPVLSMYVNTIKKQFIESQFDYTNIPPIEEYRNNNEVRDKLLQRIFRYCWDNWECMPKLHEHIISNIETKIWKKPIYESRNLDIILTDADIKNFIESLWNPIPYNDIKPGMTIDILEVQNPAGNILKLSIKENKTVAKVQYNDNGAAVLFTDGDVTISNFETFDTKIGAYFFTKAGDAAKGIVWIALKTDRVNGYRKYDKFLIDLPTEGPFDRYVKKLQEMGSKLLNKPTMTVQQIAKKHGVSVDSIKKQVEMGIKVELEHTRSKETAREIALDHLGEFPDYYTKLNKANL